MSDHEDDFPGEMSPVNRRELGKISEQKGRSFEDRVAEAYRLIHYYVEHGRLFYGRQVDLFLIGKFGDLVVHRAIECKAGPVNVDDLDAFLAKLNLVRKEYPAAQGTIISGVSFTDSVTSHANAAGIQLTLFRDLSAQLLDGHGYAQSLLREIDANVRYPVSLYVEPSIGYEVAGDSLPASEVISDWLEDGSWNQLTLLGDVGTGKTFLSRMVTRKLLAEFLNSPWDKPLPIRIDLRNADREFGLEGLVLTHLSRVGLGRTTFDIFHYLLMQGRLVLIFDGFDEMAARVTPIVMQRNFFELNKCVQGRAKVMLTCRTHHFRSQREEGEIVLGEPGASRPEEARDLYWELIARQGFRIAYLRPFELSHIENYIARARPHDWRSAFRKLKDTYNLLELSQRPMLLEMIVKSLDRLGGRDINASTLYEVFTDAWIHRDRWRDVLSSELKLGFLTELACSLWRDGSTTIHYIELREYLQRELTSEVDSLQKLMEVDNEVRTASFLTRDSEGNYGFAHKSYMEFFLARHVASRLSIAEEDGLSLSRFSPEVIGFILDMVDFGRVMPICETILRSGYKAKVSENALVLLYALRRRFLGGELREVPLVEAAKLGGAQLDYVNLEGAILLRADLCDASLREAVLARACLARASMDRAVLEKANLTEADLSESSAKGASFVSSNLFRANLSRAAVEGANFSEAMVLDVVLEGILGGEGIRSDVGRAGVTSEWSFLEEIYPKIQRVVYSLSHYQAVDKDELLSLVTLGLLSSEIMRRLERMDEKALDSYIHLFCSRVMYDLLRRRARERDFLAFVDMDEVEVVPLGPGGDILREADWERQIVLRDMVEKIAAEVPPEVLRVARAFYVEGKNKSEIASDEGISLGTVGRRLATWRVVASRSIQKWGRR